MWKAISIDGANAVQIHRCKYEVSEPPLEQLGVKVRGGIPGRLTVQVDPTLDLELGEHVVAVYGGRAGTNGKARMKLVSSETIYDPGRGEQRVLTFDHIDHYGFACG
ncbi:hypothetical protein [Acidisoma sp. C75]